MSTPQYATFEAFVRSSYPTVPIIGERAREIVGMGRAMAAPFIEKLKSGHDSLEDFLIRDLDASVTEERVLLDATAFFQQKGYRIEKTTPEFGAIRMEKDGRKYRGNVSVVAGIDTSRKNLLFTLEPVD